MAVPKKRMSKSKKNARKSVWKHKANTAKDKALSLAKCFLFGNSSKLIFNITGGSESSESSDSPQSVGFGKKKIKKISSKNMKKKLPAKK